MDKISEAYVREVKFEGCAAKVWNGVSVVRLLHDRDEFNTKGYYGFYHEGILNHPMFSYAFGPDQPFRVTQRVTLGMRGDDGRYYYFKEFFPTIIDNHIALYSRTMDESGRKISSFLGGIEDLENLDLATQRLRETAVGEAKKYALSKNIPEIDDSTGNLYISDDEKRVWGIIKEARGRK